MQVAHPLRLSFWVSPRQTERRQRLITTSTVVRPPKPAKAQLGFNPPEGLRPAGFGFLDQALAWRLPGLPLAAGPLAIFLLFFQKGGGGAA